MTLVFASDSGALVRLLDSKRKEIERARGRTHLRRRDSQIICRCREVAVAQQELDCADIRSVSSIWTRRHAEENEV